MRERERERYFFFFGSFYFFREPGAQINLQLTFQFSCNLEEGMPFWHASDSWFWMLSRQSLNTNPLSAHIISLLLDLIWKTHKVKLPLWGPLIDFSRKLWAIKQCFHFNTWILTLCELVYFLPKQPYPYSHFLDNYFWYSVHFVFWDTD